MFSELPPDYSRYSYDELIDTLKHIDRDQYPNRAEAIEVELDRREAQQKPKKGLSDNKECLEKLHPVYLSS